MEASSNPWLQIDIHPSWQQFLSNERVQQLNRIQQRVGTRPHNPAPPRVLRFLTLDLRQLQVVILGQDPYPQPGVATGRAFEVGGLIDWLQPFPQTSLRNILRLLYRSYQGITAYEQIPNWQTIRWRIGRREWRILPPDQLFASWERQGVLLLNTCLTVEGTPLGHQELWLNFTCHLLQYISGLRKDLDWFLWGKHAQSYASWIQSGRLFCSRHPMMCSNKYGQDFLKADCFCQTKGKINWLGV
jgi:uracil-DNA glycosylase